MSVLRDLLYVDKQRVRHLLAQIDGGVLESIVTTEADEDARRGGISLKLADVQRELKSGSTTESVTNVEEALLDLLEVSLERLGWIEDSFSTEADVEQWRCGEVHRGLAEGTLLRLDGETQLIDPGYIRGSIGRMADAMEQFGMLVASEQASSKMSRGQLEKAGKDAAATLLGGFSTDQARIVGTATEAFFGP